MRLPAPRKAVVGRYALAILLASIALRGGVAQEYSSSVPDRALAPFADSQTAIASRRLPAVDNETREPEFSPPPVAPLRRAAPPLNRQISPSAADWLRDSPIDLPVDAQSYYWALAGRSFFAHDQRIEFTGLESTFGVEGVLTGGFTQPAEQWNVSVDGELYFNQHFERNILVNTPERKSYEANFDVDTFEISQLYFSARNGDFLFAIGKMVTPFGRTYFPIYRNDRSDAPFIRTESIHWRETGLLLQLDPGMWVVTAALTNGGDGQDANSSKAFIGRLGIDTPNFAIGASIKWQDGTGSEDQKLFNNHVGGDVMFRRGSWLLSGEVIFDEYGFRRAGFDPLNITWGRSIYGRDQNFAPLQPLIGVGYYVNVMYESPRWNGMLNYGEFYPRRRVGDAIHDVTTRRGIARLVYHIAPHVDFFGMLLAENWVAVAQSGRPRRGLNILAGFQFQL